jgi:hypothetical protein
MFWTEAHWDQKASAAIGFIKATKDIASTKKTSISLKKPSKIVEIFINRSLHFSGYVFKKPRYL